MEIIRGEGVILSYYNGGEYLPFACMRSITLNLLGDFIGKSTIGSGDWKEKEISALDWNFNGEGIPYFVMSGYVDIDFFIDTWLAKTPIQVQCFITGESGTNIQLSGYGIFTNISITGSVNNVASVNFTGEGTGELVKT
jgi:hypothetical protein